jgi:type IV pilus assembly protein PilC
MFFYRFKAIDRNGKIARGIREAYDPEAMIGELRIEGLRPRYISPVGFAEHLYFSTISSVNRTLYALKRKKPKKTGARPVKKSAIQYKRERSRKFKIAGFTRQLSMLINSGIPLAHAVTIIGNSQNENPCLKETALGISKALESGVLLPDAFSLYPSVFPPEYIGLLRVGMETGKIADVMDTLAGNLEREEDLYERVKSSTIYPFFIFSVALFSCLFIFLFVFPQIAAILETMKVQLPLCTRIMILSMKIIKNPATYLAGIPFCFIALYLLRNYFFTPVGKYNAAAASILMPILGKLNHQLFLEKYCRIMAMFFTYNVPVMTSVKMVSYIFNNPYINEHLFSIVEKSVVAGEDLDGALKNSSLIPPVVYTFVSVGVQTGDLGRSFYNASDFFEREINQMIVSLVTLIEPLVVAVLGIFILFIILSIFLPLYQAIASIGT